MGVAAKYEIQRPVELGDLIEKHTDIDYPWRGHAVFFEPGRIVLVPSPCFALEGGFGVDRELVEVDLAAQKLFDGFDDAGMTHQPFVCGTVLVWRVDTAHVAGVFLPQGLRTIL